MVRVAEHLDFELPLECRSAAEPRNAFRPAGGDPEARQGLSVAPDLSKLTNLLHNGTMENSVSRVASCLLFCGLLLAGCSDGGRSSEVGEPRANGDSNDASAGDAPSAVFDAAVGGQPSGPVDASSERGPLRLAFEPLALDPSILSLTDFAFLPDDTLLATSKTGALHHLSIEGDETTLFSSVAIPSVFDELDCGLISIALDPDFETNALFYLGYCVSIEESGVFRFRFEEELELVPETVAPIITARLPGAPRPWHNVGSLTFDDSGALYVPFGDKTDGVQSQDTSNDLGGLLRIVPNREPDGSGHEPAPGNPFANETGQSANLYAFGLRSPWRGSLDSDGNYWVGDVGSDEFEEVNVVTGPGQNFAWPDSEGPCAECLDVVDPVAIWGRNFDHPYILDDEETLPVGSRVVWVGTEYRAVHGDRYFGQLTGKTLFGEFCTGFVRAARYSAGVLVDDVALGHVESATSWREGPDGFLYLTTLDSCAAERPDLGPTRFLRAVPREN